MIRYSYLYILGNEKPSLYIGVTSDLIKRVYEHKNSLVDGFTKEYKIHDLLYFEVYEDINEAIKREKVLKHWKREWKLELIKKFNPEFKDLYSSIV